MVISWVNRRKNGRVGGVKKETGHQADCVEFGMNPGLKKGLQRRIAQTWWVALKKQCNCGPKAAENKIYARFAPKRKKVKLKRPKVQNEFSLFRKMSTGRGVHNSHSSCI